MRAVVLIAYVVMAVWLIVSAILRVALLLRSGLALDPLPFISGGIAVVALLALRPLMKRMSTQR